MNSTYHRTNINLHQADYEYLLTTHGYGWTEIVREWVHTHVKIERNRAEQSRSNVNTGDTLSDLLRRQTR